MRWLVLCALLLNLQGGEDLKRVSDLIAQGQFAAAREALQASKASGPAAQHLSGVIYFNQREYPKAVEELRKAVAAEPQQSGEWKESVLLLAQGYYMQADYGSAIPWLEKAKNLGQRANEVRYMLGNSYIQTREAEKAVNALADMFGLPPGSPGARLIAARMMLRLEQEEMARTQLQRALEADPKLPGTQQMLGEIATFRGRIDEAVALLQKEIEINPGSANAYYKLADAHTRREDWNTAIPLLQKSIWLDPTMSGPFILLGKCHLKVNQLVDAERMLRYAVEMDQRNWSAHYLMGQTLMALGRQDEGREELKKSQQLRQAAR